MWACTAEQYRSAVQSLLHWQVLMKVPNIMLYNSYAFVHPQMSGRSWAVSRLILGLNFESILGFVTCHRKSSDTIDVCG